MGKKKRKNQKPKKKCCGKYLKKGKHCARCPVLLKEKCKKLTKKQQNKKKKNKKKKKKRDK